MTRATVLQEVRQMRFEELDERRQGRVVTMGEAAEILKVTERTFRRWRDRYEARAMRACRIAASGVPRGGRCRLMSDCAW
ncbi:MAG: helix-turn-helix domain-containing protein [Nitrospiraceae bacterium]